MDTIQKERIRRAQELLKTARHAAMATVNADGSPHNTPFFFLHDDHLEHIFWSSHPGSLHSQNIVRSGQLFVVIYDKNEGGGLYIKCQNGHELSGVELKNALKMHNKLRIQEGKKPLAPDYYSDTSPQRMYGATTLMFWVNIAKRNSDGYIVSEYRHEVQRQDITNVKKGE